MQGKEPLGVNPWSGATYLVPRLPSEALRKTLEASKDRTHVMMYELVHDLAEISRDIVISAPIQSRMYQELADGMLGFSQAVKIADVPFPFPFAQTLSLLLFFFSMAMPVFVSLFTDHPVVSPIITFLLFQGTYGINDL